MHDDHLLIEGRVRRALSQRIRPAIFSHRAPLELTVWHVPGEPVPVDDALAATYEDFPIGTRWGAPWSTSWIRARGTVPADWTGRRVEARFDIGFGGGPGFDAEALVHTADGVPIKAVNPDNRNVPLYRPAAGGERVDLLLEAAANPDIIGHGFRPSTLGDPRTADPAPLYVMRSADLVVLDEEVWQLSLDLEVLEQLMHELPESQPRRWQILRALDAALDALDPADISGTAKSARAQLDEVLRAPAVPSAHTLVAVGHAHIDSAWLWPLRETMRKSGRTFASVTRLAEDYPELIFACSQAQQYAWVEERYPEVWERIVAAVERGQWAPVGGMWVEADGNLPGGEALVRQFVVGQEFFTSRFGRPCRGVWLPDSFGYTGAYPQIARLAGAEWFLTQKISWNQTNQFPHHTFWWEGIDGTRIFTHFPPIDTYNATLSGSEVAHAVANHRDKGYAGVSLVPFGHGDGGGGPTRDMLERARRLADLEGSPKVVVRSPDEFFAQARAEYPEAPVWSGELYLELHRGTYTSQQRTKAGNRRSEHLLREAELWCASAAVQAGAPYPYEQLAELWQTVLLHQFHDILPGSSIAWVHRGAEETYARVAEQLSALIESALASLGRPTGHRSTWLVNTAPHDVRTVIAVPSNTPVPARRTTQQLACGRTAVLAEVGASRAAVLPPAEVSPGARPEVEPAFAGVQVEDRRADGGGIELTNGLLRVVVDPDGMIGAANDLTAGRAMIAPGARANLLQLYDDFPNLWDAWDVDEHYRHRVLDLTEADSVEIVDAGPLLASVRVQRSVRSSTIQQRYVLRAASARLDIVTEVDWQERETMLKAAFPLDVHASHSQSEIQFGHVERPTHTNTSWDAARFEVSAHRWVRVAEAGYGIAVANDATYGHDTTRTTRADGGTTTTIRLSLLRSPRVPDPGADRGRHAMTYALAPAPSVDDAIRAGYELNLPIRVSTASGPPPPALVEVEGEGVVLEAVKLAQDRSGDLVVRLYEARGGRGRARIRFGFGVDGIETNDLLERPLETAGVSIENGVARLALRPFQIVTLRVRRAEAR